jgi:hypothetical protein
MGWCLPANADQKLEVVDGKLSSDACVVMELTERQRRHPPSPHVAVGCRQHASEQRSTYTPTSPETLHRR